jgi:FlaA1/EpsC-like NDP-sugar epimerase
MNRRGLLAFLHDLAVAAIAWCVAFWLRFNLDIPDEYQRAMLACLPYLVGIHAAVFWLLGLYRGLWRYASLPDLQRILLAVGLAALGVPALLILLGLGAQVPRSVYLLAPMLLAGGMCGSRLLYRATKERRLIGLVDNPDATPVLVIGAGDAAALLLKDLSSSRQWRILGLLDDEARKQGGEIERVKVLGTIDRVGEFAKRFGVAQAIIAMPAATHSARKRAVDLCAAAGLSVMTVPALSDILSGKVSVSALRHIELDDLLGRDPVELDLAGLEGFLHGKTVLVTGAGGSIGSELCRQMASFKPARIVLFEQSELALYSIEQEFRDARGKHAGKNGFPIEVVAAIGDAKDPARVREVFARWRPEVVFHAAAYKHVPLMEADNALQAVRNNALGTLVVAQAAIASGAGKFVLVSTDKAVNPANVMGASKRLAELLCQALAGEKNGPRATQFVIVRFGNVLGSTGSVVPRFREQIARGGPVTVTHPEIRRYFMSIPEAAQLVLQAGQLGGDGEIYVLDMGEPVQIVDLARQMIRLSGFSEAEIRIEFSGLRAGEKLYEEPLADAERTLPTPHPRLRIARVLSPKVDALAEEVKAWLAGADDIGADAVRARLKAWIPEYAPAGPAVSR